MTRRGLIRNIALAVTVTGVWGIALSAVLKTNRAVVDERAVSPIWSQPALPVQTDVDRAQHMFDEHGVPHLHISGVGTVWHPAWTALYALQYAGLETYDEHKAVPPDLVKFRNCVNRLARELKLDRHGLWVWMYPFDNTYNDVTITAPWVSAFGQAVGIQALVASYRVDGRRDHLALAEKAALALSRPIEEGGLLYRRGEDIWFEEIPAPAANPTHILNGHMRALLALRELAEATGHSVYRHWLTRGLETLERWLPLFDTGYWFRYDLNPRKSELLFRLTSRDETPLPPVLIDAVALRDPLEGRSLIVDVGDRDDERPEARVLGGDWSAPFRLDGRSVRVLRAIKPATTQDEADGRFHPPATYFSFALPGPWSDNLRTDPLELVLTFKDQGVGTLSVQGRSIAPGPVFRDIPGAELRLSNTGQWVTRTVVVRPSDLGWWVGAIYADKHALYLHALSRDWPALKRWASLARRYAQAPGIRGHGSLASQLSVIEPRAIDNPLRPFRMAIGPTVFAAARAELAGARDLTDHQKVIRFMALIARFRLGTAPAGDPQTVLAARVGACGEFTNVLLALAATQGIAGRHVNLHNFPPGDGHTVAELFIGGKWQLYDPTYASYYTDTPEDDQAPNVLSFDELRRGRGRDPEVKLVIGNRARFEQTRPRSKLFVGPTIYERANPAGPIIASQPMTYPLLLDAKSRPLIGGKGLDSAFQGAAYLGAAGICNHQAWTLSSLVPGRSYEFEVSPARIVHEFPGDSLPFRFTVLMLSGGVLTSGATYVAENESSPLPPWIIRFQAQSSRASILLRHDLCGPNLAYITIGSFRLREAGANQSTA